MRDAVIVDMLRTAVGRFQGTLTDMGADELAAVLMSELIKRNKIEPEKVDLCVLGNVDNHSNAPNLGRLALLRAKMPHTIPGYTVEHQCASGLVAINTAYMHIALGKADIVFAGGAENMSNLPYWIEGARQGFRLDEKGLNMHCEFMETARRVCGPEYYPDLNMGLTAENLADKYNITRKEQDLFALRSQTLAAEALLRGRFNQEILPLEINQKKKTVTFSEDEHLKPNTTIESLSALRPAFKKDGTVTAGNSSGLNDAGAVMLLMSREKAQELEIKPLASIGNYCHVGVDPAFMGISPAYAIRKIFDMSGTSFKDYNLYEINEAFAAQSLAVFKELELTEKDVQRINVNGGAIAFGHPLGASGVRLVMTLIQEMSLRQAEKGIAALCCGGGTGVATEILLEK